MTITEFLLARISEDEAVTQRMDDWRHIDGLIAELERENHEPADLEDEPDTKDSAKLIAWAMKHWRIRDRVLAEGAAKRAIVEMHSGEADEVCQSHAGNYSYEPCPTLRTLALPYADHPHYDPEWAL